MKKNVIRNIVMNQILKEYQGLLESDDNSDGLSQLINDFYKNPIAFISKTLNISEGLTAILLSIRKTVEKNNVAINNVFNNCEIFIHGLDITKDFKEILYVHDFETILKTQSLPAEIREKFIQLKKRLVQKKYKAQQQRDFTIPYGRIKITNLTPAKVVDDFNNNPHSKFTLAQYEFADADAKINLIDYMLNNLESLEIKLHGKLFSFEDLKKMQTLIGREFEEINTSSIDSNIDTISREKVIRFIQKHYKIST